MDEKEKHSLRNEKIKANRASETEEQRKERLRIRREKDRARRRLRNTKPRLELRLPHNVSTFYPSHKQSVQSGDHTHICKNVHILSCYL